MTQGQNPSDPELVRRLAEALILEQFADWLIEHPTWRGVKNINDAKRIWLAGVLATSDNTSEMRTADVSSMAAKMLSDEKEKR